MLINLNILHTLYNQKCIYSADRFKDIQLIQNGTSCIFTDYDCSLNNQASSTIPEDNDFALFLELFPEVLYKSFVMLSLQSRSNAQYLYSALLLNNYNNYIKFSKYIKSMKMDKFEQVLDILRKYNRLKLDVVATNITSQLDQVANIFDLFSLYIQHILTPKQRIIIKLCRT